MRGSNIIIIGLGVAVIVSGELRKYVKTQVKTTVQTVVSTRGLSVNTEQFMITLGSIAFYITKTRQLRLLPLDHETNIELFRNAVIGILLGFLLDPAEE